MSLPRQLTEQLLSAYLDDALSGDERARVDQMLASDAAVRDQLAQMQRLQAETRQAFALPPLGASQHKLDDRFADRVLQAAFAEARRADLSSNHPLRRAADRAAAAAAAAEVNPRPRVAGGGTAWGRQSLTAALALAAVLLLAVTLVPRLREGGPAVAERNSNDTSVPTDMLAGSAEALAEQADAIVEQADALAEQADALAGPAEAVAATAGDAVPKPAPAPAAVEAAAAEPMLAADGTTDPGLAVDAAPSLAPRPGGAPADPQGIAAIASAAPQLAPLNVVMVLQVEQTDLGRSQDAVLQALQQAGIETGTQRLVDQQIVGYLQQANLAAAPDAAADASQASILFIEAPGKQLDQFIVSLFQLPEQIAGVGLNLGMDPPLVAAAGQLSQVDPSTVQHAADTATAWQLVRGEGQDQFALPSQLRAFTPLNAQMASAGLLGGSLGAAGGASTDSGPDIVGRLLMVVR